MAKITIDYEDGTSAHWSMTDEYVQNHLEALLNTVGQLNGIRC